jgi:hypothetical protein
VSNAKPEQHKHILDSLLAMMPALDPLCADECIMGYLLITSAHTSTAADKSGSLFSALLHRALEALGQAWPVLVHGLCSFVECRLIVFEDIAQFVFEVISDQSPPLACSSLPTLLHSQLLRVALSLHHQHNNNNDNQQPQQGQHKQQHGKHAQTNAEISSLILQTLVRSVSLCASRIANLPDGGHGDTTNVSSPTSAGSVSVGLSHGSHGNIGSTNRSAPSLTALFVCHALSDLTDAAVLVYDDEFESFSSSSSSQVSDDCLSAELLDITWKLIAPLYCATITALSR